MPVELAQYGIGVLAIGVIAYLGQQYFSSQQKQADPGIVEVIQNNTRVMEQLTGLLQGIKVDMAEQGAKIDELLARVRGGQK